MLSFLLSLLSSFALVSGVPVKVSVQPAQFAPCSIAAKSGAEIGHSHIPITYSWSGPELVGGVYVGKITASVATPFITVPRFEWPSMTKHETNISERVTAALLTHEKGHVEVALSALANQHLPVLVRAGEQKIYSDAARQRVRVLVDELHPASVAYDRATAHGINQENSPLPRYRGPSTKLVCP